MSIFVGRKPIYLPVVDDGMNVRKMELNETTQWVAHSVFVFIKTRLGTLQNLITQIVYTTNVYIYFPLLRKEKTCLQY